MAYRLIFLLKKKNATCKSYSHFFIRYNMLPNDIISFEQLGPDIFLISPLKKKKKKKIQYIVGTY